MIIGLFPGQGSQAPGFLSPWLELDGVAERLTRYSDAAGVDLIAAGTVADADAIRDTKVAQPLIVAASLLSWHALLDRVPAGPSGVAGHSVGEFAAVNAAGVIDDVAALRLVGIRGRAMADAAALERTGMSAILGGEQEAVLARLAQLELVPANYNGAGQIVAAGADAALAELAAEPPRGTRVIALQVAGAFHTRYMASAMTALADAAAALDPAEPTRTLWTNADGSSVTTGARALELLVGQVAAPVRWDLCMASFTDAGASGLIEFSPGGTLTGLAKRALRGVPAVAIKTPEDLDAAAALLTEENA